VIGVAIAIAAVWLLWLPLALGLMAGFPFGLWADQDEPGIESVAARATFTESADCLRYWRDVEGRTLNDSNVADCFPTQPAARKQALIACFNDYEHDNPGHDRWPEANMHGCTWDGLVDVPVRNVARLKFEQVVARPAVPRPGLPLLISVGLTRHDSAAKVEESVPENPALDVSVTVGGEPVEIGSVEDCSVCRLSGDPEAEHWFDDREGEVQVRFPVPDDAVGKRLTIRMEARMPDTPPATKAVSYSLR
jgi:hypothetical protein